MQSCPPTYHGVIKVPRYHYVVILDNNSNVSRCCVGPLVLSKMEHETCLFDVPKPCIGVPAGHFCIIRHPCKRDAVTGEVVLDSIGQVQLRMGSTEVRLATSEPFPLYPGEEIVTQKTAVCGPPASLAASGEAAARIDLPKGVYPLEMIRAGEAFHVRCVRDFVCHDADIESLQRPPIKHIQGEQVVVAGSEWCVRGPRLYIPRVEVEVVDCIEAVVVPPNAALRIEAKTNFIDHQGVSRLAGEQWLVREPGAYIQCVEEKIVELQKGITLHEDEGIHLVALQDFTDVYGVPRQAGDAWLITQALAPVHILDVQERLVKVVQPIILSRREYTVVMNPVGPDGKTNRFGESEVRRGEQRFFLKPGEVLQDEGVLPIAVASKEEALLLKAKDTFIDASGVLHKAGSRWMLHGPAEYVPEEAVEVVEVRKTIALDKNEGVYIMDTRTGAVRAIVGVPYMPNEYEVLWEKHLPPMVEALLERPHGSEGIRFRHSPDEKKFCVQDEVKGSALAPGSAGRREKFRVVRFPVQHNAAVQVNDYEHSTSRIVMGPGLVVLGPHEELTVLTLSGGTRKEPNILHALELQLGPRYSSDTIEVETSDHARLRLQLSYNWQFDRSKDPKIYFCVPHFIGDFCKTIASRIRGAVASRDFDSFHRNSAEIIQRAVFGVRKDKDEVEVVQNTLVFPANGFMVTNVDLQSVEPTDEKTRNSLQKSVQLAIEITTKSQEAAARRGNELKDQKAKGELERQRLRDKIEVEKARTQWLELQAQSEAVKASGQSVAEAKAKAEALRIQVDSELRQAKLRAEAYLVSARSELDQLQERNRLEVEYAKRQQEMEVEEARRSAEAEAEKVKRMVNAIGCDTLVQIARAGPEMQAKLLGGLGLKGYLLTDGKSPVNLFQTAQGLLGNAGLGGSGPGENVGQQSRMNS